jgi:hypothetical protein
MREDRNIFAEVEEVEQLVLALQKSQLATLKEIADFRTEVLQRFDQLDKVLEPELPAETISISLGQPEQKP